MLVLSSFLIERYFSITVNKNMLQCHYIYIYIYIYITGVGSGGGGGARGACAPTFLFPTF